MYERREQGEADTPFTFLALPDHARLHAMNKLVLRGALKDF